MAITVTHNGEHLIRKHLDSWRNGHQVPDIVVVDNASTDNTVKIIRSEYPEVTLIESTNNEGFGQANNKGLRLGLEGDYTHFFLLNQDAWVSMDTLDFMKATISKDVQFGLLSPLHMNGKGDGLELGFSRRLSPDECPELMSDAVQGDLKGVYPCEYVNAAAWMLSRECVEAVGGFDPLFFHRGEDDDYLNRVRFYGFKIGIVSDARIFHDRSKGSWKAKTSAEQARIQALVRLKNINTSWTNAMVTHCKLSWDRFTDALIFRDFSQLGIRLSALLYGFRQWRKVKKSRKVAMQTRAYL